MIQKIISFVLAFFITLSNFPLSYAIESSENIIPDLIITFQSPSYLTDKDLIQDTYNCDASQSECKVNFNLADTFGGYVPAAFACESNFSFETLEENKCNPNTIIFPSGSHQIIFKVYEKENPLNFKEKTITIIKEEIANNMESGSGVDSGDTSIDSGSSQEGQQYTNTGSTNSGALNPESNSGSINSGTGELSQSGSYSNALNLLEIPDVNIEVQSGLELVNGNYKCINSLCKVNLNLENLFTGSFDIKNYSCHWNFGSGTYTTLDTDKKCNPGYVNYGTGNFIIEVKIVEKSNPLNFKLGNLEFSNGIVKYFDDSGSNPEGQDNSGSGTFLQEPLPNQDTNSRTGNIIEIPDVNIEVQSGLNFDNGIYKCTATDCKVNLNLEKLFTGSFEAKNYSCLWNFGSGTYETVDTDKKCNPGYVNYGTGNFIIEVKIVEKSNPLNFKTGSLSFENIKMSSNSSSPSSSSITSSCGGSSNYETLKEITLQSGANKISDGIYECNEEICKINIKYDKSYNDSCLWDFVGGNYKEKYIYSCNPGRVYYRSGEYKIGLKVNKNGVFLGEKYISLKNNFIDKAKEFNLKPKAKITLQGVIGKNKEVIGNKLICKNTKECSVNFDGSESTDANKDNLDFFWDFGNGEFEEKSNPKIIKYNPGKYKVKLKVTDRFGETSEDYFFVEVFEKEQEIIELNENITKYVKIIEALPNPIGSEENEWIKIKNGSINFVNIKGLEIDDRIGEGSKANIVRDDFYLLPYQEKKLYKSETKLNLNNSYDEVNLIYNNIIIDSLIWNYEVPEGFTIKKEQREKVKVIDVIDGDTIVILFSDGKREKLRLIGVDTPETKHPKKEVEKFGFEVSNYTKSLLKGKEIELELDASNYRDKYGRLLGYVWIDNINFNKLLIEKGYARAYLYFPFKYSEDFANTEKDAKKLKLGIWGNEELKKEIQLLEKIEKELVLENIKIKENFSIQNSIAKITKLFDKNNYKEIISNNNILWLLSFGRDEKEIQKESLKEFDLLMNELVNIDSKKTSKSLNKKEEKIISYKTSKLKSGLKITGTTFPNSIVKINFDEITLETKSDELGNYTFLIKDNLKVGDYKLQFLVYNGLENYNYLAPRFLTLSKDYIFGVQDFKVKELNKKLKPKKVKKSKKKKLITQNTKTKKMKYDIKDIKKEEDKSSSSKNIILIFLITMLVTVMGFFVFRKVD